MRDSAVTTSPFRYSRLFELTHLESGFHLHNKDMPIAKKRMTTTDLQTAFTRFFWDNLDDILWSLDADVRAAIVPELYGEGLDEAYEALSE